MSDPNLATPAPPESYCWWPRRRLFGPLVLIGLGVVFLLDQFHVFSARYTVDHFWPVIFIALGLDMVLTARSRRHSFWGVIWLAAGALLLLNDFGYWNFDISRLWPLVLIALGASMLINGTGRRRWRRYYDPAWATETGPRVAAEVRAAREEYRQARWSGAAMPSDEAEVDGVAFLGGFQRRVTTPAFHGGHITAFLGGFQLDLRQAGIAGERAVLEIQAVFGGGEVLVPRDWMIDLQGHALLGGYSDETQQTPAAGAKRLVIVGTAVFGGVVIKN